MPNLIRSSVQSGSIDSQNRQAVRVNASALDGWFIVGFTIPPHPPFDPDRPIQGPGGKKYSVAVEEYLIDVDPKKIGDRFEVLSTYVMVERCRTWAVSHVVFLYQDELKNSQMKFRPVQCHRLLNPERNRAYAVTVFTTERGTFVGPDGLDAAAKVFQERYQTSTSIHGPATAAEPEVTSASAAAGFALAQMAVRRYTYSGTFLHAGFGKRRLKENSYVLILASPHVLTIVQTFYRTDLKTEVITNELISVLRALYQPQ